MPRSCEDPETMPWLTAAGEEGLFLAHHVSTWGSCACRERSRAWPTVVTILCDGGEVCLSLFNRAGCREELLEAADHGTRPSVVRQDESRSTAIAAIPAHDPRKQRGIAKSARSAWAQVRRLEMIRHCGSPHQEGRGSLTQTGTWPSSCCGTLFNELGRSPICVRSAGRALA